VQSRLSGARSHIPAILPLKLSGNLCGSFLWAIVAVLHELIAAFINADGGVARAEVPAEWALSI